ncbi:homoserine kinase [Youngiibacter multivorans]|uniref:Homoserine kinase n=2 Tax=Youngiibacter multivorans TaxID=937251 RepID=A0ABS4G2X9_9CLOT|nr:homoserine kinase [Youngiibacter multivorans]
MVRVIVPATTANLGPGFDTMGLALDMYTEVIMETGGEGIRITSEGEGSEELSCSEDNLIYKCAKKLFDSVEYEPKGLSVRIINGIPLSRGLGSSASAIIAGLLAAREISAANISDYELLKMATEVEGHPDNVAPALFGGFVLSRMEGKEIIYRKIDVDDKLLAVVAIPEFELPTEKSRAILPRAVSREDAIFNIGNASLLVYSLLMKDYSLLRKAMNDRLHEPYRIPLVPGLEEVKRRALGAGAFSAALSGAGPTVIAFADEHNSESVRSAMEEGFRSAGIESDVRILSLNNKGAIVYR